ncbi:MAG: T9SS type A sorting domain-containing protein [Bacteroidota bacterium]
MRLLSLFLFFVFSLFRSHITAGQGFDLEWAHTIGSSVDNDVVESIATDASGNVFIGGRFLQTVDFDPGTGVVNRTAGGAYDAYLAKYDLAGNLNWVIQLGETGGGNFWEDEVRDLRLDAAGNVYVTGYFGGVVDFDPGTGTTLLTSAGQRDIFVAKYSNAGALIWARRIGSTASETGSGIYVDGNANVFVAGFYNGTVDFDPGTGVQSRTSVGQKDLFFLKLDNLGNFAWATTLGSTADDEAVTIAANATYVYVAGNYGAQIDLDPSANVTGPSNQGLSDGFFGRYFSSTGELNWWATIRSAGEDNIFSLDIDQNDQLYLGGIFGAAAAITKSSSTTEPLSFVGGNIDAFIAKYDVASTGLPTLLWVNEISGQGSEFVSQVLADQSGNVFASGFFEQTTDFDPGVGENTLISAGQGDAFVVKYSDAGVVLDGGSIGDVNFDGFTSLDVDANGNLYVGGYFSGTIEVDPGIFLNSNNGSFDGWFGKYVLSSSTLAEEPTASPTALTFTNITPSSYAYSFTLPSPAADGYIHIRKAGSPPTEVPQDGTVYTAVSDLGTSQILYVGTGSSFTQSSAVEGTTYYYAIYAYNGSGSTINYRTADPATGFVTPATLDPEPSAQPSNLVFGEVTSTSISYDFTPVSGVGGYLHVRREGSAPTFVPQDGVTYSVGQILSDGSVVQHADNFPDGQATGLLPNTTYHWRIFAYNGSGFSTNYRQVLPLTGSQATTSALATEPTAQPTNLVFSNLRATGYDFSYTAANPAPEGYIGIRGIGEAPTTPPTDGVTYAIGDPVGNGFVNFIGGASDTDWVQNNATEGTTYHLAIYSFNGSGTATNYLTTNPLRGSVTPSSDNTPPVIGTNTTPTKIAAGQSVRVSVTWTDAQSGVEYVELRYGPTNQSGWTEIDALMTNVSGNVWEFTIPASEVKEQGTEYQMVAYNGVGLSTESAVFRVVVDHPNGLTIPYSAYGTQQSNYRILSIPLVLEKKSINDIFTMPLGAYDPKNWRMFRYGNGQYTEMTGTATMDVGRGYMFIAKENKGPLNTGAGVTVDNGFNRPFTFTPSNGWNLIGNPFNFNVRWADVQAENNALATVPLKVFSGGATFSDGTTLAAFSGGFIFVNGTAPITIPHVKSGRTHEPPPPMRNALDADQWMVDISLSSGDLSAKGGIGMSVAATAEYDLLDDFTVPRFLDFLELNHHKKLHGASYARDMVPLANNYEWSFEVVSNSAEELITLSWDNSYFGANTRQLVLWDEGLQRGIDMRTTTSYTMSKNQSRDFRIIYGDADYVKEKANPRNLVFHGAYPVPATEKVTFAFSTPEATENVATTVEVYDLLGRPVAQVLNKALPGGYQEVVWQIDQNQRPLPGVYVSVVKFGNQIAQKRLVIK